MREYYTKKNVNVIITLRDLKIYSKEGNWR